MFLSCATDGQDVLVVKLDSSGCMVVGGTFEKLVEQLACEEKPGNSRPVLIVHCLHSGVLHTDPKYVSTFLFGYRHLATPLEFAKKLYERYPLFSVLCVHTIYGVYRVVAFLSTFVYFPVNLL